MDKVRISIVIPVYNAGMYLADCLESIRRQGRASYEVILIDDGSTDDSAAICDAFAAQDSRFCVIHKKNEGVSAARNKGLDLARGEYVMFVDSDDLLPADALDNMSAATETDPDFVIGGFEIMEDEIPSGRVMPKGAGYFLQENLSEFYDATLLDCGELYRGPWAKLYRLSLIREYSLKFDINLSYGEDKLFVYEYLGHVCSAASVNSPVYSYFRRTGTLSGGRTTERRLSQLLDVVPLYADAFLQLMKVHPDSDSLRRVYHNEIVCNDIMRILRTFLKIGTPHLSEQVITQLYHFIDEDNQIRMFERRVTGQLIIVSVYRLAQPATSYRFYRVVSSVLSLFYR